MLKHIKKSAINDVRLKIPLSSYPIHLAIIYISFHSFDSFDS